MHVAITRAAGAAENLEDAVWPVLDRRLLSGSPRPLAVALSGGGDSLALLLATCGWAEQAGRALVVLTVDHGLKAESAAWTRTCAATAARLGLAFQALAWTGDKPATGVPAAARAARHALLGDAARKAGARVILMGHTADDSLEARLMRQEGSSTSEPREWSPSPAWPQGRGLFLLRPLLAVRRAEIRGWLSARGDEWIDDPANLDAAYARPRARQALALGAMPPAATLAHVRTAASAKALAIACRCDEDGGFEIARAVLRDAVAGALTRFTSAACLCAAGTDRPPKRGQVERLAARLIDSPAFVATLAGARIEAGRVHVRFRREAGEAARGGLASIGLRAGETAVWDGRFEVATHRNCEVRAALCATTPAGAAHAIPLTYDRLLAACGAIEREPA